MEEQTNEVKPEEKEEISLIDEAKAVRDDILTQKEELIKERKALEKAKSDSILNGKASAGTAVEPPKEETPSEYTKRIRREIAAGEWNGQVQIKGKPLEND